VYNSFLLVEGSLEVAMRLAASLVNMINSLVDSILYIFKYVIDVALKTMLDALKVLQKSLLDLLWNRIRPDAFCANMYKCSVILEDLADENSLIYKTCVKAGIINDKDDYYRDHIYEIINDYNEFKQQICEYGFTTTFGVDALRKMVDYVNEQTENIFNLLMRKKDAFRRTVQNFLDNLENLGIFDLLIKLKKYFNCILDSSEKCASIRSASNYYKDAMSKLHIEESGSDGYRLETTLNNRILNGFDARTTQVNNIKGQMDLISEMLVNPNDTASANKAYDLSKNVIPSGMTWNDIKNAKMIRKSTFVDTWKKTRAGQYIALKYDALFNRVSENDNAPEYFGTDYLIGNVIINDATGKVSVRLDNDHTVEYDASEVGTIEHTNFGEFEINVSDDNITEYQHPTLTIDDNGNKIAVSSLAAATLIATRPDDGISKRLLEKSKSIYDRFPNTIPESELVTAWS
jgi:hypothetical protein